jgi:hypothetical protein
VVVLVPIDEVVGWKLPRGCEAKIQGYIYGQINSAKKLGVSRTRPRARVAGYPGKARVLVEVNSPITAHGTTVCMKLLANTTRDAPPGSNPCPDNGRNPTIPCSYCPRSPVCY